MSEAQNPTSPFPRVAPRDIVCTDIFSFPTPPFLLSLLPPELLLDIADHLPCEADRECLRIADIRLREILPLRPDAVRFREFMERVLPVVNKIAAVEHPDRYAVDTSARVKPPKYFMCHDCKQLRVIETEWATPDVEMRGSVATYWFCLHCFPHWKNITEKRKAGELPIDCPGSLLKDEEKKAMVALQA